MLICWVIGDFVFDPDYLTEWQRVPPAESAALGMPSLCLEDVPEQILTSSRSSSNPSRPALKILLDWCRFFNQRCMTSSVILSESAACLKRSKTIQVIST